MKQRLLLFFLFGSYLSYAQTDTSAANSLYQKLQRFSLSGYGAMNYYHFNWQTDSVKRDAIDNERFILDFGYRWNPSIGLQTEIEFEHGGTGVAVEFDRFEEFGEFEFDIHKGGEVLIEQMHLALTLPRNTLLRVGRVKVPFALMFSRDEPTDYLTAVNSEMETAILPENWTENGLLLQGKLGKNQRCTYHIAFVNGLDGSAFNSANWIKRGNQRRFEMANAENMAAALRLDFMLNKSTSIGFSAYSGNTANNRPKPDLKVQAPVGMVEVHALRKQKQISFAAMVFYGALANSEALSNQNRNLSNALNVKRTPVGAAAVGGYAEVGLTLTGKQGYFARQKKSSTIIYGRFDYYDTQFATEGLIFNNPRWARRSATAGVVYQIIPEVHFKLQCTNRVVGAPAATSVNGGRQERTVVFGFGFEF